MSLSIDNVKLIIWILKRFIFGRKKKKNQKLTQADKRLIEILEQHLNEISEKKLTDLPGGETPPTQKSPSVPPKQKPEEILNPGGSSFSVGADVIPIHEIKWTHRYIKSKWGGEKKFINTVLSAPITVKNLNISSKEISFSPARRGSFNFFIIKNGISSYQAHAGHQRSKEPWADLVKNHDPDYVLVIDADPKTSKIIGRSLVTHV